MRGTHAGLWSDTDIFLRSQAAKINVDIDSITDKVAIEAIRELVMQCIEARRLNRPMQKKVQIKALQDALKELTS